MIDQRQIKVVTVGLALRQPAAKAAALRAILTCGMRTGTGADRRFCGAAVAAGRRVRRGAATGSLPLHFYRLSWC